MTDDSSRRDDEFEPETPMEEAAEAEAEEDQAAAEEEFFDESGALLDEEAMQAQLEEAMAEARHDGLMARAAWSLVHKELLILLFANCLFFAGAITAWNRYLPWDKTTAQANAAEAVLQAEQVYNRLERAVLDDPSTTNELARANARDVLNRARDEAARAGAAPAIITGLDTIRGGLIFTFAVFGFFIIVYSVRYRQVIIWPFLLNALFALWVGIPGFTGTIGSARWDAAKAYMDEKTASYLAKFMAPLSNVPPGHWLLTLGGALVLITLLKGVLSGMSAAKAKQQAAAGSRRRRR